MRLEEIKKGVKEIFSQIVPKKTYSWTKNPNGTYTIFGVEIFRTFKSEDRGEVDESGLDEIINNFAKEKSEGWYPRVHVSHHGKSPENNQGVAYLDNFTRDGALLFADFCDISEKYFQDFMNKRFPGRSVEYDPETKTIDTIALLESQCPFFKFPLLYLKESSESFEKLNEGQRNAFSKRQIFTPFMEEAKVLFFNKLKNKKTTPFSSSFPASTGVDGENPEGESGEDQFSKFQADLNGIGERVSMMETNLQKIADHVGCSMGGGEGGEPPTEDDAPVVQGDPDEEVGPSSVAMQKAMQKQIAAVEAKFQKKFDELKKSHRYSEYEARVQAMVDKDPSRKFEATMQILKNFSSDQDRENFLKYEEGRLPCSNASSFHPVTQFAKGFNFPAPTDFLQQFSKSGEHLQKVARWAYQDYQDTINQQDEYAAQKFQKKWGGAKNYVEKMVAYEKLTPGFYAQESGRNSA